MAINIEQNMISAEKPNVLKGERIYVYVPKATNDSPGIASFSDDYFYVDADSKVHIKLTDPFEKESLVKLNNVDFKKNSQNGIDINWVYAHNPVSPNNTNGYGLMKIGENSIGYLRYNNGLLEVDYEKVVEQLKEDTDISILENRMTDIENVNFQQQEEIDLLDTDVENIKAIIPSQASAVNKLVDMATMNSSISANAASFRGNWTTWADVPSDSEDYPVDDYGNKKPNQNDYLVLENTSTYGDGTRVGTWRFKYSGDWDTDGKDGWHPEFQINEEPFTAAQQAAIDSGITLQLVNVYNGYANRFTAVESSISSVSERVSDNENDIVLLQGDITTLGTNLSTEVTNRQNADDAINDEISTLQGLVQGNADDISNLDNRVSDNATAISTEITNRQNADTSLQSQINQNNDAIVELQTNKADKMDLVLYELKANKVGTLDNPNNDTYPNTVLLNSIKTALEQAIGVISTNLNNEITNRQNGDSTLQTAVNAAGHSLELSVDTTTYVLTARLKDANGNVLGQEQTVDLPIESLILSVSFDDTTDELVITLQNGTITRVPLGSIISGLQSEITSSNKLSADLIDDSTTINKFVTSEQIVLWNGKQDALNSSQLSAVDSGITSSLVTQISTNESDIVALDSNKMNKVNPTGSGVLSINRKSNTYPGLFSATIGYNNAATEYGAIAVGGSNTASGNYSFSAGSNNTSSGSVSTTVGGVNIANGDFSFVAGENNRANRKSQFVFGEYSDYENGHSYERGKYIEMVGNGTSSSNRSCARKLDWSGNEILAGTLKAAGLTDGTTTKTMTEILAGSDVTSVNGQTGAVVLTASDVGAQETLSTIQLAAVNSGITTALVTQISTNTTNISAKQDTITSSNKLDADLVDDATSTNKFVTDSDITIWNAKQNALTFDDNPTQNSTNPVKSGGVYAALSGKQSSLNTNQLAAVNSGITSTLVSQISTNQNNITSLSSSKQDVLTFDSTPTASSTNPVTSGGVYTTTNGLNIRLTAIEGKIPTAASSSNQLADKAFVNSSVQTATANFRGSWSTWADVPTSASAYPTDYAGSTTPTTNDYLVVQDASGYNASNVGTWRFKYTGDWATNGKSGWQPEYQINEEPLTAAQIAALNSGITSTLVGKISTNENNISLLTSTVGEHTSSISTIEDNITILQNAIANKYTKPSTGIPKTDLTSEVQTSLDKANTALQPNDNITNLTNNAGYTKVESSSTNGYIKINNVDTKVYELPSNVAFTDVANTFTQGQIISRTDSGPILKLTSAASDTNFLLERQGGATCVLESGGSIGLFGTKSNHGLQIRTNYVNRMSFDTSGGVTLATAPASNSNSNQIATTKWVNDKGYITGISSGDVVSALGFTPYNSTNPNGYQTANQVETIVDNRGVRYDISNQGLTSTQQANARANIGAGTSNFDGLYSSLTGLPTLGTASSKDTGSTSGTIPLIGSNGKLPSSIIPASAITDTFVVSSEAAMLALSSAEQGDVCIRTDLSKSFILKEEPYSVLANWQELLTPISPITSVNGQTGAVVLTASDVGAQETLSTIQLAAVNSGITSALVTQIGTNASNITSLQNNKQDNLSQSQLDAVNSGITSTLVGQISTNATNIAGKQDALTQIQLNAVNSGITRTKVEEYDQFVEAITHDIDNKVDKTTTASKLYGTNNSGAQTTLNYSVASDIGSVPYTNYNHHIVQRGSSGRIYTPPPTNSYQCANKLYVDNHLTTVTELFSGSTSNNTNITLSQSLNNFKWVMFESCDQTNGGKIICCLPVSELPYHNEDWHRITMSSDAGWQSLYYINDTTIRITNQSTNPAFSWLIVKGVK